MVNPGTVFEYNMISKEGKILKEKEVVGGYNQNDYVAERIWATGRDGTKIPMSMVYKKELKKMVITLLYYTLMVLTDTALTHHLVLIG